MHDDGTLIHKVYQAWRHPRLGADHGARPLYGILPGAAGRHLQICRSRRYRNLQFREAETRSIRDRDTELFDFIYQLRP